MKSICKLFAIALLSALTGTGLPVHAQVVENHNSKVSRNLEIFNEIYKALDLYYVDTLAADTVIRWAIDGMLANVDPFTGYYPAEDEDLRQMATGKYAGIGSVIRYHKGHDRVVISEPYENTPSSGAGLRAGDIILSIDGKDIKGMLPTVVSSMLRGEAGTTMELTFRRPGDDKPRTVHITRNTIQMPAIPYFGIMDEGIGYINLSSFTGGCAREVRNALVKLIAEGAGGLILDLRDNVGGAVNEAVDITNLFLDKGIEVVYTKGKQPSMNHEYSTTTDPVAPDMPLVVLVNGSTASSAEIVSGALQDMDRAVIMGTRTYGKGLVQAIRDVPYRGELKLTTGRYYIPSGRCIQAHKYNHDGSIRTIPDSLQKIFYTKAGRRVMDGGGIQPDIVMPDDTLPTMVYDLVQSDIFFDWVTDFVATHPDVTAPRDFSLSDSLYADFCLRVEKSDFTYNRRSDEVMKLLRQVARMEEYLEVAEAEMKALETKFAPDIHRDLERLRRHIIPYIESEIMTRYYHQQGNIRHTMPEDKVYRRAVDILRDPERYNAILRNNEAQHP
ncbi:MAG: S41 family peptidase [Bacteroidaceae bacterium]|nr:S41 family peptidase [Bacteroidaceae bacterium]